MNHFLAKRFCCCHVSAMSKQAAEMLERTTQSLRMFQRAPNSNTFLQSIATMLHVALERRQYASTAKGLCAISRRRRP